MGFYAYELLGVNDRTSDALGNGLPFFDVIKFVPHQGLGKIASGQVDFR